MGNEGALAKMPSGAVRILPYLIAAMAFTLAAYYGTALYNFFIPRVVIGRDFSMGVVSLSVIGGTAAFLSPCAFGMLPAYFAFYLSSEAEGGMAGARRRAVGYGLAAAAGMVISAAVLAALILMLGKGFAPSLRVVTATPNPYTHGIRLGIALLLVVMGIMQIRGRSPLAALLGRGPGLAREAVSRVNPPHVAFFSYGLLYVLMAAPCTANLMAAPLLFAAATEGAGGAAGAIILFSLTMAILMIGVSVLIGSIREPILRTMRASTRYILQTAGTFMLLMGLTLLYFNLNLSAFRETFFHFPIR